MNVFQTPVVIFKTHFNTIIFDYFSIFIENSDYDFYTKTSVSDSEIINWQYTTLEEFRKSLGSTIVSCLEFSEAKTVRKGKFIDYITIHSKHEHLRATTAAIYKFNPLERVKDLLASLYEENVVFYHESLVKEMNAKVFSYEVDK